MTVDWWSVLYMLVAFPVSALVHELGHAVAGRMLGATEAEIQFGNEADRAVTWRLGWLAVTVHLGVRLWLTVPVCWTTGRRRRDPLAQLLFSLGGPMASALLVAVLWPWTGDIWSGWVTGLRQGHFGYPGRTWIDAMAIWAWFGVLIPMMPMHYRQTGLDSDGLQAWNAFRALTSRRN